MNDKEVINGYGKPIYLYYSNNQINNMLFRKYVDFLLSNVEVDSSKMIKIRNEICYISKYLKETETTNVTDIVQRDFDTYTIKVRYELEKGHAVIKHLHNFFDFLYKNGYMNHEIICNNGTIKICDIDDLFRKKHKGCGYRKSIKYTSVKNKEALDILYSFAKDYLLAQNFSYSYTYQIMCQAKDFCNFFRGKDLRKLIERDFYDYNSLLLNFPRSTKNNMYLYSTYFTHYLIRFYSYDNIELLDDIIDFKIKYSNYSKDISFNIPYLLCDRNITYEGFNRLREYIKYLCTLDLSSNIIVLRMRAASFVETNSKESKDNASLSHKMAVNIELYKEYVENGKYISYGFDSTGKRKNPFVFSNKKMVLIGNNSYECIVPNN